MQKKISENIVINKFLKKLNFKKSGTFNFDNDAAYLNNLKNYKTVVTTDTITQNIDFFQSDPPESVAQKLICVNLSDLSAMGSFPIAYTLNLSLPTSIGLNWLKKFTTKLYILQKKYNFYLLGGDISRTKELTLSATFFGQSKLENIISQKNCNLNDDIWVTGNLGNSYLGYKILTNSKLKISKQLKKTFIKYYLYPKPFMFGKILSNHINAAIDISDGFYGDLNKILNKRFGARINLKKIPITNNLKSVILKNNINFDIEQILGWGDDYQLIFTASKKNRHKILKLGKKNKFRLTNVGYVIKTLGIFDDSMKLIKNLSSFDHFR